VRNGEVEVLEAPPGLEVVVSPEDEMT
jgi:hypothetical protein